LDLFFDCPLSLGSLYLRHSLRLPVLVQSLGKRRQILLFLCEKR